MENEEDRRGEREALARELAERAVAGDAVLAAIAKVPRHRFVPDDVSPFAYEDRALPIAAGQTISQPYIVAYMTERLELEKHHRVLEIGTGSGYQAAVLAELAGEVYSVEIVEALHVSARRVLRELGYERIRLAVGDGCAGWPEHAPFDRIIVTAAAARVPEPLVEQLAAGGRLLMPLDSDDALSQWIWRVDKDEAGEIVSRRTIPVRFVPMTGAVSG